MESLSDILKNDVTAFSTGGEFVMTGQLDFPLVTSPIAPATDKVAIFGRKVGGRMMPAFMGPSGLDSSLQPFLARNKIGFWNPPGNAVTLPGVLGFTAPTIVGTVTARNITTTNMLTRMKRLGVVSAATIGAMASWRVAAAQYTTGDGAGLGGFHTVIRFGVSDAASVSGARMFVGLSATTAAATNVDPGALLNCIGMAQISTDATQWYLVYGGSAAQTKIALGTGLGAPTLVNTAWDLALFSSPNQAGIVSYEVTNLATAVKVSGTLTPATLGVQTPNTTTLLTHQIWRTNNATALAVAFDVSSVYIETDQ